MGTTETLARYAVETRLSDIPRHIVDTAKLRILDTVGVMIGGSVEPCTRMAVDVVEESGGNPEANIAGYRLRTSRINAAFANGVAAHALDYDDIPLPSPNHISVTTLPAPLALGEAIGARGEDLLLAYIIGYEIEARIANGMNLFFQGWQPQGVLGCLGAAVSSAKIMGLDLEQTRRALGIAAASASGIIKHYGTLTKPFMVGNASRNGVVAALLAARGLTSNPDVLDTSPGNRHDRFGFCEVFAREGNYNLDRMTEGLGDSWELPNSVMKHHPGSTAPFMPTDITLDLVAKHDIKPEDVDRVDVLVAPFSMITQQGPHPRDGMEARYSIWYNVAVSILDRKSGLSQYADERVTRPDVAPILEKVSVSVDPEMAKEKGGPVDYMKGVSEVTIGLKDGQSFSERREGYPFKVMGWEDVVEKCQECADYAGLPQKGVEVKRAIDMVQDLERLSKVQELLDSLTPATA